MRTTGKFSGVEDASATGMTGVYLLDGRYVVRVKNAFLKTSRKKDDLAIIEIEIVSSDNSQRKPGTSASWVVNFKQDAALGNIKAFLAAVNGIDPGDAEAVNREITEEFCELCFAEDNPLEGKEVAVQCTTIKTRAGTDFTRHFWSPVEEAAA